MLRVGFISMSVLGWCVFYFFYVVSDEGRRVSLVLVDVFVMVVLLIWFYSDFVWWLYIIRELC